MLEAPEALSLSRQLTDTVKGKRITVAIAGYTPHKFTFFYGAPALYEERLLGQTIGPSHAYGGMIETGAGDVCLLFSDGVNLTYHEPGAKLPSKHQLLIGFDDESAITASVRMYGAIWCYPAGAFDGNLKEYYNIARSKPQVMSGDFTEEYFLALIGAEEMQKKSAKAALATEQSIPGLGNGVLQDILYNAGIHPKTKVKDIPQEKRKTLYGSLRTTLDDMLHKRGRNSESDLFGRNGGYIPWLSKNTVGEPCIRCGAMILKENYMGGSIYYCPGCQK